MPENDDPLGRLVINAQEVNRDMLASVLQGKVSLDPVEKTVHLIRREGAKVGAREQVLLALLGTKALSLYTDGDAPDSMTPAEISEVTGQRGNTVRPVLMRLAQQGLIVKRGKGYAVHNAALHLAAGAINHPE
jgi:hypothetical protein